MTELCIWFMGYAQFAQSVMQAKKIQVLIFIRLSRKNNAIYMAYTNFLNSSTGHIIP
jgi:hypothetical protein